MKIYLVYPPPWTPAMPYLALPALTAFLRARDVEVVQRDLNVETYDTILSRAYLEQSLDRLRAQYPRHRQRALPERIGWAFEQGHTLAARIESAKDVFRSPAFYDGEKSLEAFWIIVQSLDLASLPFYPARLDLLNYRPTLPVDNSHTLLQSVRDPRNNMFVEIFKRGIVADIVREQPDILGISIPTEGQMLAAMTLAYLVKQTGIKCHITVGGPHISMLREQLPHTPALFDWIDSAIIFDGEIPLLKLADALDDKIALGDVPNLIHRTNGAIHVNATQAHPSLSTLTPDFDGLPLERYLAPDLILPLLTARGCYHGRCAFCNVGYGAGKGFVPLDVEQVVEQVRTLHSKYGARHIFFADEATPPRTLRVLSEQLANLGLPIDWCTCARFEKVISAELLQAMSRGGCRMLFFGLESAAEPMIQRMVKGTENATVSRVLKDSARAGIWNHTFILFGFPTETMEDAQATVNFLYAHQDVIHSAGVGIFVLERYSPAHSNPDKYGIAHIIADNARDLAVHFDYVPASGLDSEMASTVLDRWMDVLPTKRYGQYYTHDVHRFLYASHLYAQGKPFPLWLVPE